MYENAIEAIRNFVETYRVHNPVSNPLKPFEGVTVMPINPQSKLAQAWGVGSVLVLPIETKKGRPSSAGFIFNKGSDLELLRQFAISLNLGVEDKKVREIVHPNLDLFASDPSFVMNLQKGVLEDILLFNTDLLRKAAEGVPVTLFEMGGWLKEIVKKKTAITSVQPQIELSDNAYDHWQRHKDNEDEELGDFTSYITGEGSFTLSLMMGVDVKSFRAESIPDLVLLEKNFFQTYRGLIKPIPTSFAPKIAYSTWITPLSTIHFDGEQGVSVQAGDMLVASVGENLLTLGEHNNLLVRTLIDRIDFGIREKLVLQEVGQYKIDLSPAYELPCDSGVLSAFVNNVVSAVQGNYTSKNRHHEVWKSFRYALSAKSHSIRSPVSYILGVCAGENDVLPAYPEFLRFVLNYNKDTFSLPIHWEDLVETSLGKVLLGYIDEHKEVLKNLVAKGLLLDAPLVTTEFTDKECEFRMIDVVDLYRFVVQSMYYLEKTTG